ncbi:MAG: GNAT family N-acetyltransferase [Pirellulales bacterium]|nr:GNAT family N-acetyltransferase [Pirellulales bacterium]
MDTALATTEWQTFTQQYWNVKRTPLEYTPRGSNGPSLRVVCYRDRKGRVTLPPYQPHLPLQFSPTPTEASYRIQRQWLQTARLLVDDMIAHGTRGYLTFSPAVTDPRPWIWSCFHVSPWFTNYIDFPFQMDQADRVVRQQANKALRAGYVCTRSGSLEDALACLAGSEKRNEFSYGITLEGLRLAARLLGPDALRVYTCHARDGEPATARVVLHRPDGRACDWMAGTADGHLRDGATQLLISYMLDDLQRAGAAGYNSCGASQETVAQAKTMWGGRLMTQYCVQGYGLRSARHFLGDVLRYMRRRKSVRRRRAADGQTTTPQNGRCTTNAQDKPQIAREAAAATIASQTVQAAP